ncbi:MAG: glutathione S-transferase family protein [Alphaproteobacteria bacterium]|nr:glutathione S-transferase family protein [Alphaproteobacteria bacterium]
MSDIRIYGIIASRAFRCLWAADELGLKYEHVPVKFGSGDTKSAEFLSVNPNGRIPALSDGPLNLCESMAINLYLASKFDGSGKLWPRSVEDQGRVYQWSFWVVTEVEKPLVTILLEKITKPREQRDEDLIARMTKQLQAPFRVLEGALQSSDYLLGADFSIADLNVASVMSWAKGSKLDLTAYPKLAAWLDRCLGRPAAQSLQARRAAA